jgi:hypothetical protein
MAHIADIVTRSHATFLSDAVGVIALAGFAYGLLYLPHLI